jgi:cytochrome c
MHSWGWQSQYFARLHGRFLATFLEVTMPFRLPIDLRLALLIAAIATMLCRPAAAQDAAAGEKVYGKCRACHQVGEGAKNLVGPELNGLIGRKAGTVEGYNYSAANKNSGIVWDEASFREYIRDPKATIPETKMTYAGLKSDSEIDSIVAYLKTFDKDGKKMP